MSVTRPPAAGCIPDVSALRSPSTSFEEDLLRAAEAAHWAPSIHNSQPWRFRRLDDGLAVLEDPDRGLSVVDPYGRERIISCGAAVLNARMQLASRGYRVAVDTGPVPDEPTMVATVRVLSEALGSPGRAARRGEAAEDRALAAAIPIRRTHRRVYRSHVVAEDDLLALRHAVQTEGARLAVAGLASRRRLAHLIRRAIRVQVRDAAVRAEVESWVRHGSVPGHEVVDGVPTASLATTPLAFDVLVRASRHDAIPPDEVEDEMARSTVLVISTRTDTRGDWVLAGMAMQRLLLTATTRALVASFAQAPLQCSELRPEVAEVLGIWGAPQVLLRVGRALTEAAPTPRRPLEELYR